MSVEAIERLIETAESNHGLLAQIRAARSPEEKAAVASSQGFDVSAAEFKALRDMKEPSPAGELSDQDLDGVAGGITDFLEYMAKGMYYKVKRLFD